MGAKVIRYNYSDDMIKTLDEKWFNYNEWLMFKNKDYGTAEIWKRQVYNIQFDAALALSKALSRLNSDDSGNNDLIRIQDDHIVPKVIESAFYLRYCILLLQGCGDKLAQMIRCALGITQFLKRKKGEIIPYDATENSTTLRNVRNHLELKLKSDGLSEQERNRPQNILNELDKYLADKSVSNILVCANKIKHKWQLYYKGEGLQPVNPEIKDTRNNSKEIERIMQTLAPKKINTKELLTIGVSHRGINIEEHINLCFETNNMFVDTANAIINYLDFDKLYVYKDEMKILEIGVKKEVI